MATKKRQNSVEKKYINNQEVADIIVLSHPVAAVEDDRPLERKTNNKELLERLLEIEREIIQRARAKGIVPKG